MIDNLQLNANMIDLFSTTLLHTVTIVHSQTFTTEFSISTRHKVLNNSVYISI
jgi:hypothetical protein